MQGKYPTLGSDLMINLNIPPGRGEPEHSQLLFLKADASSGQSEAIIYPQRFLYFFSQQTPCQNPLQHRHIRAAPNAQNNTFMPTRVGKEKLEGILEEIKMDLFEREVWQIE